MLISKFDLKADQLTILVFSALIPRLMGTITEEIYQKPISGSVDSFGFICTFVKEFVGGRVEFRPVWSANRCREPHSNIFKVCCWLRQGLKSTEECD